MKRLFTWFILIVSIVFLVSSCGSDSNVDLRNLDDDDDDDDEITTESIETDTTTTPGASWAQQAYIKAVNNGAGDYFGYTVAIDGDTLAVGASSEDSNQTTITNGATASTNNGNNHAGAVYVYKRVDNASSSTGFTWAQEAYIKAANSTNNRYFGQKALEIDEDTIAVGVPLDSSNQTTITNGATASTNTSSNASGAVYVYKRVDNASSSTGFTWTQEAYIKATNADANDQFGSSMSLDGDTIAVGAKQEDSSLTGITNSATVTENDSGDRQGAVYVYKRTGSSWAQEAYFKALNNTSVDNFGQTITLDGDTIAVGAHQEDSNETYITNGAYGSTDGSTSRAGAVYVYKRTGSTWAQEAFVKASNTGTINDYFGWSVSIDGETLAVGTKYEDSNQTTITNDNTSSTDDSYSFSGAVYVYKRTGSTWAQEAYIKASNNNANDYFGEQVSIDNDTLVVGAYGENSNLTTITNDNTSSSNNDSPSSGAVYVYKRTGSTWAQEAYVKASNNGSNDNFGERVAVDNVTIVVGARNEDSDQTSITNGTSASSDDSNVGSGAVYVYVFQ